MSKLCSESIIFARTEAHPIICINSKITHRDDVTFRLRKENLLRGTKLSRKLQNSSKTTKLQKNSVLYPKKETLCTFISNKAEFLRRPLTIDGRRRAGAESSKPLCKISALLGRACNENRGSSALTAKPHAPGDVRSATKQQQLPCSLC